MKKMKNSALVLTIGALLALNTTAALAQARSFEGVDLSVSLGMHSTSTERTFLEGSTTGRSSNYIAQLQFNHALNDKFVLGLGAWRALSDAKFGTIEYNGGVSNKANGGFNGPLYLKDMYSFYVAPGYAVNENLMVYAKLGNLSGTWHEDVLTLNMTGTSTGIGMQWVNNKNMFFQLEVLQNTFQEKAITDSAGTQYGIANLSATTLNTGLGYKF